MPEVKLIGVIEVETGSPSCLWQKELLGMIFTDRVIVSGILAQY
jgi:hypothetical protein